MTARVTASTRYVGSVHGIAGVRVGDQVLAQISAGSSGHVVLVLQDPASVP